VCPLDSCLVGECHHCSAFSFQVSPIIGCSSTHTSAEKESLRQQYKLCTCKSMTLKSHSQRQDVYQSSLYSPAVFLLHRMACHSAILLLQCRILDSQSHGKVTRHGDVTNCAQLEDAEYFWISTHACFTNLPVVLSLEPCRDAKFRR
jgi:hypothetical protein